MTDHEKKTVAAPATGISESERMAKIRELLVGPALADTSAKIDESVGRLDDTTRNQQEAISMLQSRLEDLEERQRDHMNRLQMRLLGMVEAILADEDDVRARLIKHENLMSRLEIDNESGSE